MITCIESLAWLFVGQGQVAEALSLFRRALALTESALGGEHPTLARKLYSLAALYTERERYADAEPLFARALAINEQCLASDHLDLAQSLNGLAVAAHCQGDVARAAPL